MPHITIEYSSNVAKHHNIQTLTATVHDAALAHGLATIDGLRTRAVARDYYVVADNDPDFAFVAIHVRIGPGRSEADKSSFITQLLDAAEDKIASDHGPLAIMWSIELNQIDPSSRINRNEVRKRVQDREISG